MRNYFISVAAVIIFAASCSLSCSRIDNDSEALVLSSSLTKANVYGAPKLAVYVETNDVNPLNALAYKMNNDSFIDILELFAANIHKQTVNGAVEPTLYLNDKLAPVLNNGGVNTYVRPLQAAGIKVLLTVLGDWQHIGVANMTDAQTTCFANILAWTVEEYGLDGIGFDDEYADYNSTNSTSYSEIITKLHALLPSNKLITVFDWGHTSTLNAAAVACIDYAYHGHFGSYWTYKNVSGLPNSKWSPISLNLSNTYNSNTVKGWAADAIDNGYGAIMCFNLRPTSDKDPLPVFQAISDGAYAGATVTCSGGNLPRTAGSVTGGFTITSSYITANPHSVNN